MKEAKYVGCYYMRLASRIIVRFPQRVVEKKKLLEYLGGIPNYFDKSFSIIILEEMIKLKLAERKGKGGQYIFFPKTKYEAMLKNSSQLYKYVGLY